MPEFDVTVRLRYERPDGGEPVAPRWWHDDGRCPTEDEAVRQCVMEAIPGVLPDDHGDEAATLVECRGLPGLSLGDVDELLAALGPNDDDLGAEYECLPRLRELRAALADVMERYEGDAS